MVIQYFEIAVKQLPVLHAIDCCQRVTVLYAEQLHLCMYHIVKRIRPLSCCKSSCAKFKTLEQVCLDGIFISKQS
jgi:hypothetical protein